MGDGPRVVGGDGASDGVGGDPDGVGRAEEFGKSLKAGGAGGEIVEGGAELVKGEEIVIEIEAEGGLSPARGQRAISPRRR